MNKKLVALSALACAAQLASLFGTSTVGKTTFRNRSAGSNKILQEVNTIHFMNPCDTDCLNGYVSALVGYDQSFDRDEIGKYLFYSGTNTMLFGSVAYDPSIAAATSTIPATGVDFFVENIFLNNNPQTNDTAAYNGTLTALPRVENAIVDLNFRLNLDEWVCGLYFDIHAPINWTRWNMNLKENTTNSGVNVIQQTFGNDAATASPMTSIIAGLDGQTLDTASFPLLKQKLNYGRVDGAQTKTRLADVEAALGYNFLCCDYYHVGIDIRGIFPTGNRPNAEYWFDALVGNGHQFGAGVGASAHYELWNNCCDSSFSMWLNGKVYHMFSAKERRIFDLKNSDGSQNIGSNRLLIKKFSGAPGTAGNPPTLTEVLFGPNVLALQCKVKNDVLGEAAILFDYQRCGLTLDAGYKLWARTKDKISLSEQIAANTYGVKGVTATGSRTGFINNTAVNTASQTKINGTSQIDGGVTGDDSFLNNVYLSNESISVESAEQPTAMSHTVFAHVAYAWECCDYTPFIGFGGQVEFSGRANNALDLWGIWAKAGFAFS